MDLDNKEDLRLLDHLNKCRCCFENFNQFDEQVQITDLIEKHFLELTQIELNSSPSYSKSVCLKCTEELQSISNFRLDLITKQQKLYDFVTTSENNFQDAAKFEPVNIKIEKQSLDEFDNIFKFESQYKEIEKSEVPVSEAANQSPKKNCSLSQLKITERKNEIKVQKKSLVVNNHNTKNKDIIVRHTKNVREKPKNHICSICDRVFTYTFNLEKHMQIHNKNHVKTTVKTTVMKKQITTIACPECGITMANAHTLSKHIRRVHLKEKNFFCDLCDYRSFSKNTIMQHIPTHLPLEFREKLHCSKCEFETISDQFMKSHMRSNCSIGSNIKVCHCGKQFIKQEKKESISTKHICPHCGIMVGEASTLNKHIRRVHLKEKNFFCDLCDYGSIFKNTLTNHIQTHIPIEFREKLHCSKCEYVTISDQVMKSHIRSNCIEKEKVECVCFCGKVFNCKKRMDYHVKHTHGNYKVIKNHICTICEKAFTFKNELKKHMATHTGIKDVACEVCGKMFVSKKHLKAHSVYHKDQQFVCSFEGCTKKFFTSTCFNDHKKTHLDQRDFACNLCDKKYFIANHLHRHILHFHKQLKVSCELPGCSSKFARKETYRNHVLSHHKDLSEVKTELLLKKIREMKQE